MDTHFEAGSKEKEPMEKVVEKSIEKVVEKDNFKLKNPSEQE